MNKNRILFVVFAAFIMSGLIITGYKWGYNNALQQVNDGEVPLDIEFNAWIVGAHVNESFYNESWYAHSAVIPEPEYHNDSFVIGAMLQVYLNGTTTPFKVTVSTGTVFNITIARVSGYSNAFGWSHLFHDDPNDLYDNNTMTVYSSGTYIALEVFGYGTFGSTEWIMSLFSVSPVDSGEIPLGGGVT